MSKHPDKFTKRFGKIFPILQWAPEYEKGWLRFDLMAGLTLAAFTIPEALAYSELARLPPQAGLYASILPPILYTIFGTSRHLVIGPTAAISILIASGLAALNLDSPEQYAAFAALTALMVGVISIAAYILRLGFLVNYISESVLIGFTTGAGLYIASTQIAKLFGIHGSSGPFFNRLLFIGQNLAQINIWATLLGAIAIGAIYLGERKSHKLPWPLIVVLGSVSAAHIFDFERLGVHLLGSIPSGLPNLSIPDIFVSDIPDLLIIATAAFLLAYLEGMSMSQSFASKYHYRIDPNQELLALGMTSFGAGLTQSYPVAGSFSRSALNEAGGAKTQLANGVGGLAIGLVALFFTSVFTHLAEPVLAAVVLIAVRGLFKFSQIRELYRVRRVEFWPALGALLGVLIFGVLEGVVVGALISLLMVIARASTPRISVLGKIPGRPEFAEINESKDIISIPGLLILRPEEGVFYANAGALRESIVKRVTDSEKTIQTVVLDLEMTGDLDLSGAHMLLELKRDLDSRSVAFRISRLQTSSRNLLERLGLIDQIGWHNIHPRTLFAVAAYLNSEGVQGQVAYDILPDLISCVQELLAARADKVGPEHKLSMERIDQHLRVILDEIKKLDQEIASD